MTQQFPPWVCTLVWKFLPPHTRRYVLECSQQRCNDKNWGVTYKAVNRRKDRLWSIRAIRCFMAVQINKLQLFENNTRTSKTLSKIMSVTEMYI